MNLNYKKINKIGRWASIIFTIMIIAIDLLYILILNTSENGLWRGIEAYASTYKLIEAAPIAVGLLLIPSFLFVAACIHFRTREDMRIWSLLGFIFAAFYVHTTGLAYYIQISVVFPLLSKGDLKGLDMLAFANPHSVMWALNYYGWFFLGVSTFLFSFVFTKGRLELWIKRLFILYGIFSLFAIVGYILDSLALQMALVLSWYTVLPVSTILLSKYFHDKKPNSIV